jgi:ABC-type transport system involved in multi-copper enzyme maturation permease subunit
MIASIKAEWRKNRFRPAFLIAAGSIAGIVVLLYSAQWYQATHPGGPREAVSILTLYPDQFVNNVMGAGFPLGAAIALVLGALIAGSEYSWGTLKTVFTQRPGRLSTLVGRVVTFQAWMGIMTLIIFVVGAVYSVVVASLQGHSITWPAAVDIAKGIGAIWLILAVNGSLGMALGALFKQSAAALGVGLIYVTLVQILLVRFITIFSGGAYKWIANWFDGQNANALLQTFTSPAFGHSTPPAIGAEQAVLVLVGYLAFFLIASAALLRQRDVT